MSEQPAAPSPAPTGPSATVAHQKAEVIPPPSRPDPRDAALPERPSLVAVGVAVGLLVLFVTDSLPGGLTGGQGFLLGVGAVVLLVAAVSAIPGRRSAAGSSERARLTEPVQVEVVHRGHDQPTAVVVTVHLEIDAREVSRDVR